jgi:hypothetical protein
MEDEDEHYLVHQCCDCGIDSPRVKEGDTLVSVVHGWRLQRRTVNGQVVLEWRCGSCWQRHKGPGRASSPQLIPPAAAPAPASSGAPSSRPPAATRPPPTPRPSLLAAVREALKLKP